MEYVDKTLVCQDCCKEFLFSAAEQLFFASKNFQNLPKHCRECRARRAGAPGKPKRLIESRVVCAQCGVETVVPFLPRKNLAVYCRECFQQQRNKDLESPAG
jgi:CxxC-x17-CxxC domain-containing protein